MKKSVLIGIIAGVVVLVGVVVGVVCITSNDNGGTITTTMVTTTKPLTTTSSTTTTVNKTEPHNPPSQPLTGLEFELNDDFQSYSVVGIGTCKETNIVIPDIYEGLPVTSIGRWAFYDCDSLISITIPNSVSSIGEDAFSSCDLLERVTIGDYVTTIGDGAFFECTSLTSVTIPDSVITIGDFAFCRCRSLVSINFEGTKEQWYYIDKGGNWDMSVHATEVTCADGIVTLYNGMLPSGSDWDW